MGHRRAPLRAGVPRDEVRGALGLEPKRAAALLARLVADGRVAERGTAYALPDHRPTLDAAQEAAWSRARDALARAPLAPPDRGALEAEFGVARDLLAALVERGDIVRAGDVVFLPEMARRAGEAVIGEIAAAGRITVSRAREVTGWSRKYSLPFLGYLDEIGITRRVGDDRVLIVEPEDARARLRGSSSRLAGRRDRAAE